MSLHDQALQDELDKYSYKPNHHFVIATNGWEEAVYIELIAEVPDRNNPAKTTLVHTQWDITRTMRHGDTTSWQDCLRYELLNLIEYWEKHESKEWFQYNGVRVNDPHS